MRDRQRLAVPEPNYKRMEGTSRMHPVQGFRCHIVNYPISPSAINFSAICTAFVAAPFLI
jgi:hypothetical protein